MSLTMSATFSNSAAASRAVRLLRQAGVGVQRTSRPAPTLADSAAPSELTGTFAGVTARPIPHALSLLQGTPEPTAPARCDLSLSVEPSDLAAVREIIYRCGGVLR